MLRKMQMVKLDKRGIWLFVTTLVICLSVAILWQSQVLSYASTTTLTGMVLVQDKNPQKQVPVPNASIEVAIGKSVIVGSSSESGYFRLTVPRKLPNQEALLTIRHADYQEINRMQVGTDKLLIEKLTPLAKAHSSPADGASLVIANVKIRYTSKAENTINVGSIVRTFSVPNVGNEPCGEGPDCSPDRKWKATTTTVSYDAGESNQFINVRASCVAGPCAFTRIKSSNSSSPIRKIEFSVTNWSDPATYLLEAEVSRTMVSDLVRESFPAIFGTYMDFTVPASAEGPSIEAELNGTAIIFPLGPNLLLSWATCTAEPVAGQTRLFRCELKPNFVFR